MFGGLEMKCKILILCLAAMILTGCESRTADCVEIYNRSNPVFDNTFYGAYAQCLEHI